MQDIQGTLTILIFGNCDENIFLERHWDNEKRFHLIGDSGYPLEPWLITPFRSPAEGSVEMCFNKRHNSAHDCIKKCVQNLKAVFRCLLAARKLKYEPVKVSRMINACCALHNMRLAFNIPVEGIHLPETSEVDDSPSPPPVSPDNSTTRHKAERVRRSLVTNMNKNTINKFFF